MSQKDYSPANSTSHIKFPIKRLNPFTHPVQHIGSGTFGAVFRTMFNVDGKGLIPVAVKAIEKKASAVQEIAILELVSPRSQCYQYVLCLYDYFKFDGKYILVEEYIPGKDLFDLINDQILTKQDHFAIILQCLKAVKYLHARQIYHNDIKPENIMYVKDQKSVVIDFGLSCASEVGDPITACKGREAGTVHFFSPQRFLLYYYGYTDDKSLKEIYRKGDIYALGLSFFQMFVWGRYKNREQIKEFEAEKSGAGWVKTYNNLATNEQKRSFANMGGTILSRSDFPVAACHNITAVRNLIMTMCSLDLKDVPSAQQCITALEKTPAYSVKSKMSGSK